jgi:RsmE family RNA methyltransferase
MLFINLLKLINLIHLFFHTAPHFRFYFVRWSKMKFENILLAYSLYYSPFTDAWTRQQMHSSCFRFSSSFTSSASWNRKPGTVICRLNRLILYPSELIPQDTPPELASTNECDDQETQSLYDSRTLDPFTAVLKKDDYRTIHAAKVLGLRNGDCVRAGVVEWEMLTDVATIQWIPEGKVKKEEPLANGNPPGSLRLILHDLIPIKESYDNSANKKSILDQATYCTEELNVSLLLALPRPIQLNRMLPMIAQMGVRHLILTGATKVPRDYFGSHLFRQPDEITYKLVEGLCQSGDVRLPKVSIRSNLRDFLSHELNGMFPLETFARVVAHPTRRRQTSCTPTSKKKDFRMRDVKFPDSSTGVKNMLLAVGPEGGWEEPEELDRFHLLGFQQVTLGPRILRSDVAVISLLSLANEICQSDAESH